MSVIKSTGNKKFSEVDRALLSILEAASEALSSEEIAKALLNEYFSIPSIGKWKDSSHPVGNAVRYVLAKPLHHLKREGYIELDNAGKWRFVMDEPLLNAVVRGYASRRGLSQLQAMKELLCMFINREKPKWESYVKALRDYDEFLRVSGKKSEKILGEVGRTFPLKEEG